MAVVFRISEIFSTPDCNFSNFVLSRKFPTTRFVPGNYCCYVSRVGPGEGGTGGSGSRQYDRGGAGSRHDGVTKDPIGWKAREIRDPGVPGLRLGHSSRDRCRRRPVPRRHSRLHRVMPFPLPNPRDHTREDGGSSNTARRKSAGSRSEKNSSGRADFSWSRVPFRAVG